MKKYFVIFYVGLLVFIVHTKTDVFAQDSKHEKWHYYINSKGEEVIKVSAFRVNGFSDGMAMVTKYSWDGGPNAYNNYGYIDTTGKLVIKHEYEEASDFKFGVAYVKKRGENHFNVIDKAGKKLVDKNFPNSPLIQDNIIIWREGNSFGIMDFEGKIIVPVGKYVDFGGYDESGLICVGKEKDANTWLYGFVDKNGKEVIPCTFRQDGTSSFSDGLARMRLSNGKIGFIDTKGNVAIPGIYATADAFAEGFYPAAFGKNRTMWGLVDSLNKTVIQGKYDDMKPVYKGVVKVELNGKYGYLRTDGTVLIPIEYNDNYTDFPKYELVVLEKEGTLYVYNIEGNLILKSDKYKQLVPNPELKIITFVEHETNVAGFMNFNGEIIYRNEKYSFIGSFNDNRAMVRY